VRAGLLHVTALGELLPQRVVGRPPFCQRSAERTFEPLAVLNLGTQGASPLLK
jgi:hypothetical protein